MQKTQFYYHDRNPAIPKRKALKLFITNIFSKERKKLQALSYIFCSDEYLLGINKEFLKQDFFTDVITFSLNEDKKVIKGEVYISVDRVKDNAKSEGVPFMEELHRVVFHGALHLCGYKDKSKNDVLVMRAKEDKNLKCYFKVSG